jgi:ubiquinone/menaquinone biosynthesis C-methylase UbiE
MAYPTYLERHYCWAYIWRSGIWLFDHQPIINTILFFQYQRLMRTTLDYFTAQPTQRVLQLTCVYGQLTPHLLQHCPQGLHIMDVVSDQLKLARRKCCEQIAAIYPVRMNAESLAYASDSFDCCVLFFLLHEMPPESRRRTLSEALRTLQAGGRLLITEYGACPEQHYLYRITPWRWLLGRLEPFLPSFWHEELDQLVRQAATDQGKHIEKQQQSLVFQGFYRVVEYTLTGIPSATPCDGTSSHSVSQAKPVHGTVLSDA